MPKTSDLEGLPAAGNQPLLERAATSSFFGSMSSARRLLLVMVVLAALGSTIIGGVVFWHWRHPTVFYAVGRSGPEAFLVGKVGEPQTAGMTFPRNGHRTGTVHVIAVVPDVVHNTATATFTVDVCTLDPRARVGGIILQSQHDTTTICRSRTPAQGADLHLGPGLPDQIVVTITPSRSGLVSLRGVHLTYTYGWKRGTQNTGLWAQIRAK
jgi:hypothetical protein